MDMIKLKRWRTANFLDVGGTANAQTVEAGFRIILKDPKVKQFLSIYSVALFVATALRRVLLMRIIQSALLKFRSLFACRAPMPKKAQKIN